MLKNYGDIDWNNFHDAELLNIKIIWELQQILIEVIPHEVYFESTKNLQIIIEKVTEINCELKQPWGESVFINEINFTKDEDSLKFRIQMQSGDLIQISGGIISIL